MVACEAIHRLQDTNIGFEFQKIYLLNVFEFRKPITYNYNSIIILLLRLRIYLMLTPVLPKEYLAYYILTNITL